VRTPGPRVPPAPPSEARRALRDVEAREGRHRGAGAGPVAGAALARLGVLVEAAPGLPAEEPRGHHLPEERRGPVLRVSEPVIQDLHDLEARVEPDEVSELEGAYRVVHPELHHGIDRLFRRDAVLEGEDGLVEHRHQDPVRHEAGEVVDLDGRLPEALAHLDANVPRRVARLEPAEDPDEIPHTDRTEGRSPHGAVTTRRTRRN